MDIKLGEGPAISEGFNQHSFQSAREHAMRNRLIQTTHMKMMQDLAQKPDGLMQELDQIAEKVPEALQGDKGTALLQGAMRLGNSDMAQSLMDHGVDAQPLINSMKNDPIFQDSPDIQVLEDMVAKSQQQTQESTRDYTGGQMTVTPLNGPG